MTKSATTDTLTLPCDVCGKPVSGDGGYLCISFRAINEHEQAAEAWKQRNLGPVISGASLLDYPNAAPWHIYHRDCDPSPDGNDYWFHASAARTARDLLARTAHLLGKGWFAEHTDWDEFLYRILNANPDPRRRLVPSSNEGVVHAERLPTRQRRGA